MSFKSKSDLSETDFLKKFAVESYNRKYKKKLDYKNFVIKSTKPAFGFTHGYQLETIRSDDFFVIMLYFNLGIFTQEHLVRVEVIQNANVNAALGDEVYVVTGEVARSYLDDRIYKFKWIKGDGFNFTAVMFMNNDFIMFSDGDIFSFMNNAPAPPFPPVADA